MRRSGFERRLRDELRSAAPPRAGEAERRAWHVVRAAHAERSPARVVHRGRRLALAAVAAALLAVVALSPAGAKVGDWIGDVVDSGPKSTRSALGPLPAPGRLLVVSPGGPWVVEGDGARRRLGRYRDATWSPGGLYVAAAHGRQLVALEPDGDERWVRPAAGLVSAPRWSPDGFRIAYRSGDDLWVVWGNNGRNWLLARGVGAAPPAWQPGREPWEQVVAFPAGDRIRIVQVDGRRKLGATPAGPEPRELWWTRDGRRLVAVSATAIRVFGPRGRLLRVHPLPPRLRAEGSAMDAVGRRLAVTASRAGGGSELLVYGLERGGAPRRLFAGQGFIEGVAWSIDGRMLVFGLPQTDQWVFLRPDGRGRLEQVVPRIREWFAGSRAARRPGAAFPRPAGWCYAEPKDRSETGQPPCSTGAAAP